MRKLIAWVETKLESKKIQEQKDAVRNLELETMKKYPEPVVGPYVDHPEYSAHLAKCLSNFREYIKYKMPYDNDRTWLVGDSIAAQARDRLRSVDPLLNMALGGMWAHHMLQLINDMTTVFKASGFIPKNIVIGTPGGNNLLNRQEIKATAEQFMMALKRLRELYPASKIIVYGLPATINAYITIGRHSIDTVVIKWVQEDRNAVYLLLIENFIAKNRILPKADMSSDGVHMTPLGQLEFDDDIRRGKTAPAGSLIP